MIRGGFPGAEDRPALRAVMRRPSESHGVACRANAILLLDDGWSCARVAAALSTRLSERLMRDRGEVAACIAATRAVIYGRSGCLKLPHRPASNTSARKACRLGPMRLRQAAFIATHDPLRGGLAADEAVCFADAVYPECQSRPAHGWPRKDDKGSLEADLGAPAPQPPRRAQPGKLTLPRSRPNGSTPLPPSRCLRNWRPAIPATSGSMSSRATPATITPAWSGTGRSERMPHQVRLLPAHAPHPGAIKRLWGVMRRDNDAQHVPCELRALRRGHLRFLPPTIATRVDDMARHRHR